MADTLVPGETYYWWISDLHDDDERPHPDGETMTADELRVELAGQDDPHPEPIIVSARFGGTAECPCDATAIDLSGVVKDAQGYVVDVGLGECPAAGDYHCCIGEWARNYNEAQQAFVKALKFARQEDTNNDAPPQARVSWWYDVQRPRVSVEQKRTVSVKGL